MTNGRWRELNNDHCCWELQPKTPYLGLLTKYGWLLTKTWLGCDHNISVQINFWSKTATGHLRICFQLRSGRFSRKSVRCHFLVIFTPRFVKGWGWLMTKLALIRGLGVVAAIPNSQQGLTVYFYVCICHKITQNKKKILSRAKIIMINA